jgi:Domain of unknown function (DUF1883)
MQATARMASVVSSTLTARRRLIRDVRRCLAFTITNTTTTMQFIHAREYLNDGDVFEVECDTKCNVQITTDGEFSDYKAGNAYRYYGGYFTHFPARLAVPHSGNWNLTIDVGEGYEANIRYSIVVIRKA